MFIWIRWLLLLKKLSNLHTSVMLWLRRQSSALIPRSSINDSCGFGWIWPHFPPVSSKWPLIDALPILFINSLVQSVFPCTYFYLEVNEFPWLLRGPIFPFLPALVILYDGPHRKAFPGLSACARCRATCSAVRLRVGVFGWALVPLFILWVIGLCLWFPSWCWVRRVLPQGHLGVNHVAAPGSQRGPVSSAGGRQEPLVLSLPLFLPIGSAQFFLSRDF